jgi:hypothetical protein
MAICAIVENRDASAEKYDQVREHVNGTGPVPPEGARLVMGGPANPGFRMISVWESREARERFFAERLGPAYKQAGLSLDGIRLTEFELTTLVAGDLTEAPQPA